MPSPASSHQCTQAGVLRDPSPPPLPDQGHQAGLVAAARGGADWLRFQIWPRPGRRVWAGLAALRGIVGDG